MNACDEIYTIASAYANHSAKGSGRGDTKNISAKIMVVFLSTKSDPPVYLKDEQKIN